MLPVPDAAAPPLPDATTPPAPDASALVDLAVVIDFATPPDVGGTAIRMPVSDGCYRNNGDVCKLDGDCHRGGCGNEVCYSTNNPISACNCVMPTDATCGCVGGLCTWFK